MDRHEPTSVRRLPERSQHPQLRMLSQVGAAEIAGQSESQAPITALNPPARHSVVRQNISISSTWSHFGPIQSSRPPILSSLVPDIYRSARSLVHWLCLAWLVNLLASFCRGRIRSGGTDPNAFSSRMADRGRARLLWDPCKRNGDQGAQLAKAFRDL